MGRQIPIIATAEDEALLLRFLRSTADIALVEAFAPTIEGLWVSDFCPTKTGHWTYLLWNRAFPWNPAYGTVGPRAHDRARIGWSYVSNAGAAPVVEFLRSGAQHDGTGRLYWAKAFSAPHGLAYDVPAFEHWYNQIVRWVRKHGVRHPTHPLRPYLLPQAHEHHNCGTA